MGSVLVWGSTIVFRASSMVGWVVVMVFLPPPFLRHLPIGGGLWLGLFSSFMPVLMVGGVTPESWLIRLMPPGPMVFAWAAR